MDVPFRKGFLKKIHINNANLGIALKVYGIDIAIVEYIDANGTAVINLEQKIKDTHLREYYNRVLQKALNDISDWEDSPEKLNIHSRLLSELHITQADIFILLVNKLPTYSGATFRKVRGKKFQGLDCSDIGVGQMQLCNVTGPATIELEYLE